MASKLPKIISKKKICIICEGYEEYEYLDKLKSLDVWNSQYEFTLVNAESNGNIPARYQDKFQNGSYDIVLVFCDTDKKPYEQYEDIKRKINEFHGIDNIASEIIIFGNPCTMQIIIEHWEEIKLESHKKNKNAPIIESLLGLSNYKGREDQRHELFSHITKENYKDMVERVKKLSRDDKEIGSSNFGEFIDRFTTEDESWIEELNSKLEE